MNRPNEGLNPAEAGGFEPPVREKAHGSLANCWFQPLTQTSKVGKQLTAFSKCGAKVILLFCSTKLLPNFFFPVLSFSWIHIQILSHTERMLSTLYYHHFYQGSVFLNSTSLISFSWS